MEGNMVLSFRWVGRYFAKPAPEGRGNVGQYLNKAMPESLKMTAFAILNWKTPNRHRPLFSRIISGWVEDIRNFFYFTG